MGSRWTQFSEQPMSHMATALRRTGIEDSTPQARHDKRAARRPVRPTRSGRLDLTCILQNIATLLENGVSLPKALLAVSREQSLQKHAPLLDGIRRKVETGETFSGALAAYPQSFDELIVHQIRVGERSGTLAETLAQVVAQLEKRNQLRAVVIKKLAYPTLLLTMGIAVVTFMLIFVVPVFEKTYAQANIPLPLLTQMLIGVGTLASDYWWIAVLIMAISVLLVRQLRKQPAIACRMDEKLLQLPLVGPWFRDLAVLQLMDVLGNLLQAGFVLAEALRVCADSVGNRAVRRSVQALETAVHRGERFSRELDRHRHMFPPVVSQLVIVGEQTGNLDKATEHIREHLRREIERKTSVMVGTIEPVLTIAIGIVLLAIYLPMFDMIGAVSR